MVLGEDDPAPVLALELAADLARQVELLSHPQRHRLEKGPEAGRREGEVGLEDALELQKGLVVEADVVQIPRLQTGFAQAIRDRVGREGVVVLDAGEAFFLGRRHDLAIDHQRRGRVVVVGGNAEDCGWFPAHHSVEFISRLFTGSGSGNVLGDVRKFSSPASAAGIRLRQWPHRDSAGCPTKGPHQDVLANQHHMCDSVAAAETVASKQPDR